MEMFAARYICSQSDDSTQKETDGTRESFTQNNHCKENDASMHPSGSLVPLKGSVPFGSMVEDFTQTGLLSVGESTMQAEVSRNHNSTETPSFDDSKSSPVPEVLAIQIDYFLWNYAKANAAQMANDPIHRTKTVFYWEPKHKQSSDLTLCVTVLRVISVTNYPEHSIVPVLLQLISEKDIQQFPVFQSP